MKFYFTYEMLEGYMTIVEEDGALCEITLHRKDGNETGYSQNAADTREQMEEKETVLIKDAAGQLQEYFAGSRKGFALPIAPQGTAFQKAVWKILTEIPYGKTLSYGEVAALAGSPKGARAAGMACHNNPLIVVVPCHRVIGKNGSLTGFGGGLDVKEKLLALEQTNL